MKTQVIDNKQEKENYNKAYIQNQKRKLEPRSGLIFNRDRGEIAYLIQSKSMDLKVLETNIGFPSQWKKALEYANERKFPILSLPIIPSDLPSEIVCSHYRSKVFQSVANEPVDAIIFDSSYKVISPEKKEISINKENDSLLTIITRDKCSDLKKNGDGTIILMIFPSIGGTGIIIHGIFPIWKN